MVPISRPIVADSHFGGSCAGSARFRFLVLESTDHVRPSDNIFFLLPFLVFQSTDHDRISGNIGI